MQSEVVEGMNVFSADGKSLGKVVLCEENTFYVEKGFLLPTDYAFDYQLVADIKNDNIILRVTKSQIQEEHLEISDDISAAS